MGAELVDLNVLDSDGRSKLHHAAVAGRVGVVRALVAAGALVNTQDEAGFTPLHSAASAGHDEVCAVLLSAGAEPNARNENGATPLHYALSKGHGVTAVTLLEARAEPTLLDKYGATPLHRACSAGRSEAVRTVCSLLPVHVLNLADRDGNTATHLAAAELFESILADLVDAGADVDALNMEGKSPLDCLPPNQSVLRARLLARIDR